MTTTDIDVARTRLSRAPSVEDYARMTQAARLSAARLVEEQARVIAERRAALRSIEDADAGALVRGAAQIILDQLTPDPPDLCLQRQRDALADADTWVDPRLREAS